MPGSDMKRELKQIKLMVEGPKLPKVENAPTYFKAQRKYSQEVNTKTVDLADKLGPYQVSIQTGILEYLLEDGRKME